MCNSSSDLDATNASRAFIVDFVDKMWSSIFLKGKMADGLFCMYSQPQPPGVMLPARRVQLKGLTPGQRVSWGLNMFFFPKCFRHTDSVDLELCLVSDHTNESSWQKFHNEKTKIPVISFCKKDGWPFKFFFMSAIWLI